MRILLILLLLSAQQAYAQADFNVFEANIADLQEALSGGHVTSVQLVNQYIERIEAFDRGGPELNSVIRINPDAVRIARALDTERQTRGARSLLHGVPVLVKDNYNVPGMPTTGGSVALANFMPNAPASQIERLIDAGAIVLAKTNLHEFAYGITTVGSIFGRTRNPYDLRRVPGGSSGGTGAAVAASFGAVGLGSDTCGSIRIPAAFNNLVGLRPTKGLSSIHGILPLAHTQDVGGPLARSAEDLAIVLDIVSGFDPADPATELMIGLPALQFRETLGTVTPGSLRLGKLTRYFSTAADPVTAEIDAALDWFAEQGAEIVELEVPNLDALLSGSDVLSIEFPPDLESYLATFGSEEVRSLDQMIERGLFHQAVSGVLRYSASLNVSNSDYQSRLLMRSELRAAIEGTLRENDLDGLVYPTIGQLPVRLGDPQTGDPATGANCTLSANSGLPAISFSAGFTDNGLPVGIEILGPMLSDAELLAIAHSYEKANHIRRSPAVTPAIVQGVLPQVLSRVIEFNEDNVQFEGIIEIDLLKNEMRYSLAVAPNSKEIYAVTLVRAPGEGAGHAQPVMINLLPPQRAHVSGEFYLTARFREALNADELALRVFAESLDPSGSVLPLPN